MKKSTIISGVIGALMCLAFNANAQYLPTQIHRDRADFIDNRGMFLSDQELIGLVGEDVFFETVVGARKQYNTGRKLVISGAAGLGVGLAGMLAGTAMIAAAGPTQTSNGTTYFDDEELAVGGAAVLVLGSIATALGGTALSVGIPFKAIGQGRLNWVENEYNDRARDYSLHVGSAPHGIGLTLNF